MHRAFRAGRRVFITRPRNHFPLVESATRSLLFAGGIGVTPLLAMAHRLHALGAPAAHHAQMPPMVARHHLDDGGALAVPPDADDEALVAPFHV